MVVSSSPVEIGKRMSNKIHKVTLMISDDWAQKVAQYVQILDMTQHWMPTELPDQAVVLAIMRAVMNGESLAFHSVAPVMTIGSNPILLA